MSRTEISREKILAYSEAIYRAGTGPSAFVLRIGTFSPELERCFLANRVSCALFITAFNPLGIIADDESNESSHAHLGDELRAHRVKCIEGEGADPAGLWPPEKSYLALGVNAAVARELGLCFKQDAVVWADKDAIPQLLLLR